MVHDWWSCDSFDADFNGVARWVWELCPMSCGKCPDEPPHPAPFVHAPGHDASKCTEWGGFDNDCCAEHHATSCQDGFVPILSEHVCNHHVPVRVTYYSCVESDTTPSPPAVWMPEPGHDPARCTEWGHHDDDCCAEHVAASCEGDDYEVVFSAITCDPHNPAPAGVWRYSCVPSQLPAPGAISGDDAQDVFRGLMETTERMASSLHLPHDLHSWERFAWQRRRRTPGFLTQN